MTPARAKTPDRALLLTPGAGADRDQPSLVAIERALEPVPVERMDFPYRLAGRKSPDKPAVLLAAVREGAAKLAQRTGLAPNRLARSQLVSRLSSRNLQSKHEPAVRSFRFQQPFYTSICLLKKADAARSRRWVDPPSGMTFAGHGRPIHPAA